MAELLFTSTSPAACSAAHRLLAGDRLYFKQIGRTPPIYVARHRGEVDSLKRQAELKRAAEERTQQAVDALTSAAAKPRAQRPTQAEWLAGPQAGLVASLETYALGRQPVAGDAGHASALEVLAAMGAERTPQGATSLLQSVGYWPLHVQLSLLSSGLTERFTPELEAQAAAVAAQPPPDLDADRRTDLRDLAVYTIDDATTTEIDDGLSAERLPGGGVRVWVHVADPTRWVRFGDPLDIEARRRSKTLYLPTGMVPMFPLTLATGPFSLRAGEESCALSVCCVVGEDGEILPGSIEIGPSTITPTHRLTYEVVDEMLDVCTEAEEPALHALATAAEARRRYRTALGAVEIAMPEPEIVVRNEAEESPEVVVAAGPAEASASKQLVAEMMILAGEVCARLGAAKGVPLPYRSQPDPVLPSDEELEAVPPGPCRMVLLRSCMPRSVTTAMDPQRHAGLGLDAYAQVTSPIRRYGDLLAHWQLKAVLRGEEPPLGAAQMSDLLSELGNTTQRVSRLERDAQSYWVALYFKHAVEADPEAVWSATFMGWFKQEAGLARVLLDDMGLETLVKVVGAALPGAALKVRCTSADPLMGVFRLEEMVRQRAGRAMEG